MTAVQSVQRPPKPWIHARPYPWWPPVPQVFYINNTAKL